MNRNTKVVLGILITLVLLCGCTGVGILAFFAAVGRTVAESADSGRVAEVAEQIATFELPAGFEGEYSMAFLGFAMVGYSASDGHSHIVLVKGPAWLRLDQGIVERQMRRAVERGREHRERGLRMVGEREVTIRGEQVTFTISEGFNSDEQPYRQMAGVFQGEHGPVFVMIERPVESWDQAEVDAFLASLR